MRPFRLTIALTLFVSTLLCGQSRLASAFDIIVTSYVDSGFSGTALVAEQGKVTLKKGYGYANKEKKILNTPSTLFNIASIGKQFTVYAILLLEQRGKLRTSDYVSTYVGPFHDVRDSATVHHLLAHTSGIINENAELQYDTKENFIRSVKKNSVQAVPGTQYRYTNAGYTLLAGIVEIVSGMRFEDFLLQEIFLPCKMEHTGFPWEPRMCREFFATGYYADGKPAEVQPYAWGERGPSNVLTSVEDLYKWMQAVSDDRFMTPAMKEKILYDFFPGRPTYAWNKATTSRQTRLYHKGGGRRDFESQLMWYPDDDIVVMFFINNNLGLRRSLFTEVKTLLN